MEQEGRVPPDGEETTAAGDHAQPLLARKNQQVVELRSKLLDTRRTLNGKLEDSRAEVRRLRRQLAVYERRHRMRGVDALAHNRESTMDDFFAADIDPEPYVRFGAALRLQLRKHRVRLDGLSVADAGVGPGIALKELLRGSHPAHIVGFDYSRAALETARQMLPSGRFEHRGIYDEPYEQFDVVICTEVLEHLERPADALNLLVRMLRPGGCLLLTVPDGRIDFSEKHINFWSPESWGLFLRGTLPSDEITADVFQPYPETGHQTNLGLVRSGSRRAPPLDDRHG